MQTHEVLEADDGGIHFGLAIALSDGVGQAAIATGDSGTRNGCGHERLRV